jgi:hypothetical protein
MVRLEIEILVKELKFQKAFQTPIRMWVFFRSNNLSFNLNTAKLAFLSKELHILNFEKLV